MVIYAFRCGLSNRPARGTFIACSGRGDCGGQVQGEACRGLVAKGRVGPRGRTCSGCRRICTDGCRVGVTVVIACIGARANGSGVACAGGKCTVPDRGGILAFGGADWANGHRSLADCVGRRADCDRRIAACLRTYAAFQTGESGTGIAISRAIGMGRAGG